MKKNLQVKKLWVSKETLEGGLKKVWFQTIFGSKKFGLKLFVGLKIFRSKFLFGVKKIVWIQKFQEKSFGIKFFVLKKFKVKKCFKVEKRFIVKIFFVDKIISPLLLLSKSSFPYI